MRMKGIQQDAHGFTAQLCLDEYNTLGEASSLYDIQMYCFLVLPKHQETPRNVKKFIKE